MDKRKQRWIALRLLEKNEGIVKSIVKEYAIESEVLEKIDLIRNQEKEIDDEIIKTLVKTAEVIAKTTNTMIWVVVCVILGVAVIFAIIAYVMKKSNKKE